MNGTVAGYGALIEEAELAVPRPAELSMMSESHRGRTLPGWRLFPKRQAAAAVPWGHLAFALKWEPLDLGVLHAWFTVAGQDIVRDWVKAHSTSAHARRAWFLYEWLTGKELDLPSAPKVRAIPVVDASRQFALATPVRSSRHATWDNLPGPPDFCPLVRRTPALEAFAARGLDRVSREIIERTHRNLSHRAAAFLLLNDSRASFAIESEPADHRRSSRWARAIARAGTERLTTERLLELQAELVDPRFTRLGLRREGGFVGQHDRRTAEPLPDHLSAKPDDLVRLVEGMVAFAERAAAAGLDPIASAAALAFGFVYVHPFEDGNGRIHRWLIHQSLARAGYSPPGVVFPISAAILRHLDTYRGVLESRSKPLLDLIAWRPTPSGNVEVTGDSAAFYRYFDATAHAEFLAACVAETVDEDLPREIRHLRAFDAFATGAQEIADLPARQVDLLHRFLVQGQGRLSRRAIEQEFAGITAEEVAALEALHRTCFESAETV